MVHSPSLAIALSVPMVGSAETRLLHENALLRQYRVGSFPSLVLTAYQKHTISIFNDIPVYSALLSDYSRIAQMQFAQSLIRITQFMFASNKDKNSIPPCLPLSLPESTAVFHTRLHIAIAPHWLDVTKFLGAWKIRIWIKSFRAGIHTMPANIHVKLFAEIARI